MNMMGFRPVGMARGGVVHPNNTVRGNVAHPNSAAAIGDSWGGSAIAQLLRNHYVAPNTIAAQAQAQAPAPVARNASVDSGALDRFRREFGREPRDTAELQEYMISGGGVVTPMRDGGMMGFRPVGYQEGGNVSKSGLSAKDVNTLVNGLVSVMRDGTSSDVGTYINMNRSYLEDIAGMNIGPAKIVRNMLLQFSPISPPTQPMQQDPAMPEQQQTPYGGHGGGELLAPPGTADYAMYDDPAAPMQSQNAEDAYYGGGFPGPSFVPSEGQTAPDFRSHGGIMSLRR